jgi:hypothetical protein
MFATKPGLLPEDTASSTLTGQAVANGDANWFPRYLGCELTIAARGKTVRQLQCHVSQMLASSLDRVFESLKGGTRRRPAFAN